MTEHLLIKALGYRALSFTLVTLLTGWEVAIAVEAIKVPLYMIYDWIWEMIGRGEIERQP